MPVPLPSDDDVDLAPPGAAEVQQIAEAIAAIVAPPGGPTDLQRLLMEALFPAMTGHDIDLDAVAAVSPEVLAEVLHLRNEAFRARILQVTLLCALILRPLPPEVVARVEAAARALGVDDGMVAVARRFAEGSLGLAAVDFERNGYTSEWTPEDATALHTSTEIATAWDTAVHDDALAARWDALGGLPDGTLGKSVWKLYRARGFEVPGRPGSAPPLLAQHDWVHVLADYGTCVENELEAFAFIARANDDMKAFSLLAMVVSLFETGYLRTGAGLFEADLGHLSVGAAMAVRIADAMRRGALCHDSATGSDSIDYLRVDWFEIAHLSVGDAQRRFGVTPRSHAAIAAGSLTPWEPGGISEYQQASGQAQARRDGRSYDSFGAAP